MEVMEATSSPPRSWLENPPRRRHIRPDLFTVRERGDGITLPDREGTISADV